MSLIKVQHIDAFKKKKNLRNSKVFWTQVIEPYRLETGEFWAGRREIAALRVMMRTTTSLTHGISVQILSVLTF